MAAITNQGNRSCHFTLSATTAQTFCLLEKVKSLRVINHGAAALFVRLYTSTTQVIDDAGVVASVADADETYVIPGAITSGTMGMREILRSPRGTFVYGSVVGNANKVSIEGHNWY